MTPVILCKVISNKWLKNKQVILQHASFWVRGDFSELYILDYDYCSMAYGQEEDKKWINGNKEYAILENLKDTFWNHFKYCR